jgi:hypothetical protein
MKTYIINLDPHDDIISARDKMGWAKTGRILLVWPEREQTHRLLNRRLDLVLLQRHAEALGAQLGLISRDSEIRYHAPRLGILVFKNLRQAQRSSWRLPHSFRKLGSTEKDDQAPPSQSESVSSSPGTQTPLRSLPPRPAALPKLHPTLRLVSFALGVLAVFSLVSLLIPSAQISLQPAIRWQEITIEVHASQDFDQVSLAGAVPARPVSVIVEGRDSLPTSGSITLPDKAATGQVLFTNLTDEAVTIPEGTIILDKSVQPLHFATTQEGKIPAGAGQTSSVPVRCLSLGSQGNLQAGKLIAIEGLLGTQVTVTNPQPFRNGADRVEPAPTAADRTQLRRQLLDVLQESALAEIQNSQAAEAKPAGDNLVLADSLYRVQIVEETYLPSGEQPADQLSLSLRVEYQALVISQSDLETLADAVLTANRPGGFAPIQSTLQIENVTQPALANGLATWKMIARQQIQASFALGRSNSQATRLVLGLPLSQAENRLGERLLLAAPPQIVLQPDWWPRLPMLPFRIHIQIAPASPGSGE